MIVSDISVKRPVFAAVISLLLLAFGAVSYDRLSLREYPDIDPPIVTVEVEYPGAPANIIETRITELIEERISGIEGIDFIESESRDGAAEVMIQFVVSRDIDAAANDVRDRVSGILDNLPEEANPPEVQKVDSNDDVIIWRNLTSETMTLPELTDYAERYLVDQYSVIDGVARVRLGGGQRYAMRVWLDRRELAARNLSVGDVESALRADNIELPAGSLESNQRIFQARVDRNFKEPEAFKNLVIGQGDDGYLVRLGDVARVELGVEEDRITFKGNGISMIGLGVVRQSNANTLDVAEGVRSVTERLNTNLPKGMVIADSYDASVFISSSIEEVYSTLLIAMVCVIFVIYLFLGNIRATLIPALAVPVSVTATFIAIYAMGFSINLLTLLALVLSIGLVVDDAIVMLENIVRRIQDYGETPLVAAYRGAREVGFAVIATTLVLIAVFVPITFLEGDVGRLFTEFALTMSAAVGFSSVVALTLSPMLASKVLRQRSASEKPQKGLVDTPLRWLSARYLASLRRVMAQPLLVVLVFVGLVALTVWVYPKVNQEFTPKEDRGSFFLVVDAPEGASFDYIRGYMDEIERRLLPYVESGEATRMLIRAPRDFGATSTFNTGIVIAVLEDWSKRRSAWVIMDEIREKLADLPGVRAFPIMRQGLGGGTEKPVQFVLSGSTYEELAEWRDIVMAAINENNPGLLDIDADYKETRPQLDFVVDYDRAASLGVTTDEIGRSLETLMGGRQVTTFLNRGEEYDVIVEGERSDQRTLAAIQNIYVRSERTDQMIPLSNLVTVREYGAARSLLRFNKLRSITIEADLADGYSLGNALEYLEQLARDKLPDTAVIDYKGQSRDFVTSASSLIFVFLLGVAVVYLVLAAQFESFVHPVVIMLTVPLAIGGGLFGLWGSGLSLNIYSQVGLIMLVGLAAKNGILIVEFANQRRDAGLDFDAALLEATQTRFRPIVMTALTTIAGSVPLVIAAGAGAETRIVIGTVVLWGVTAATFFTLYLVPVAYGLISRRTRSPEAVAQQLKQEESQQLGGPVSPG